MPALAGARRALRRRFGAAIQRSDAGSAFYRIGVRAAHALAMRARVEERLIALLDLAGDMEAIAGRIVVVGHGLAAGGSERQMLNTVIGLDRALPTGRFESVRLALDPLPEDGSRSFYLPQLSAAGLRFDEVPAAPAALDRDIAALRPQLSRLLGEERAQKALAYTAYFRAARPELAHLWQDWINVLAGIGALIAGVPAVLLSARNLSPVHFLYWHPLLRPAYRALLARDKVRMLNNSRAGAADYAFWLGIPAARIGVIRNGVAPVRREAKSEAAAAALRRAAGIPDGAPVVGSVFRFWPEKRPALWVRTAARIAAARPDAHFLIAGWGPLVDKTRALAARLGLGHRLAIVSAQQDIAAAICAGDVFLLTSRAEGIPNVVLEAQSLGVPVVATNAGGTAETLCPGRTGAIAADRPAALAREVLAWLGNDARLKATREAGPRWVAEQFALDRMLAETMAAYDRARGRTQ